MADKKQEHHKSYKEVMTFIAHGSGYRRRVVVDKNAKTPSHKNHCDYCIDRVVERVIAAVDKSKVEIKRTQKQEDAKADFGSIDENGDLRIMDGSIKISQENQKKLTVKMQEIQEWLDTQPIYFEPYMMNKIPEDLTISQTMAFKGFVLPENYSIVDPFAEGDKKP